MVTAIILTLITLAFVLIVIEDIIHVNKAKTTLFFGTLCWIILFISPLHGQSPENVQHQLDHNILEIATLWLFLMAAMTFVAYLNSKGFIQNIVHKIMPSAISERKLMFLIGGFSFLFSSISDNITATLISLAVVMSLKLDPKKLIKYATLIIFSVNSGGVSLITGDVTTLMIFLDDKVTIGHLLLLVVPALFSVALLAIMLSFGLNGQVEFTKQEDRRIEKTDITIAVIFLSTIVGTLTLSVLYHVPPLLTFLFGLSLMFLVAQFLMRKKDVNKKIIDYIREIEYDTLLFFVGVLLLVGALKEVGMLSKFTHLYELMPAQYANYLMGILSAAVDNVPLTAALLKAEIVMSPQQWLSFTYATGVGGSMLIIGSAAGIIAMSKVKALTFMSYLRMSVYLLIAYTIGYMGSYLAGSFI
ncbi:sodium:proton antiporter NhaD [Pseudoalteromonas sp. SR44-5]|jgi:Na+/H+ antiporter NhaD/arsenite permease-like protein|uniref:Sodium:proton antiporter n=3 Tax=Gammaproteobacteria TaxID=1236 RepID=A0ABY3F871_9GAMM|nr:MULTISPECIES: sodium:proton antiporter NhaD [Pseudoalteromonas]MBB1294456.1 sodium:proton antiporter NhaD [Pseudoalteromonas sp. SR41-4]MBB1300986.1 sodium:proton antiporter NhaD [Pseudoalteromonas sp. SR44-8]MBB1309903.1 sodium:proton antiporter NhaD [Pseudoalteromonas sp. SR41-8]MBB1335349.1 sodium:proton antiporter NhaD [Pseudoalteromonas sp. SR41-6]MBB1343773.1 sodium:proton antiporter NhaD [Pseudoalteromonas sp. SR45-6]|tara:strand:- start:4086 stop:5333 length:1248 start_codon:yes stop_codon:yes gene_type:complete